MYACEFCFLKFKISERLECDAQLERVPLKTMLETNSILGNKRHKVPLPPPPEVTEMSATRAVWLQGVSLMAKWLNDPICPLSSEQYLRPSLPPSGFHQTSPLIPPFVPRL